jgi:hypothetical protein
MLFPVRMLDPGVLEIGAVFPAVVIWLVFPHTRRPPELEEKLRPILHGHRATSWSGPEWKTGSNALVLVFENCRRLVGRSVVMFAFNPCFPYVFAVELTRHSHLTL